MTGGSVAQIRDLVVAVERIDQSRQPGRLAGTSGQHHAAATLAHQCAEAFARMARQAGAFEYHFVAARFKTASPMQDVLLRHCLGANANVKIRKTQSLKRGGPATTRPGCGPPDILPSLSSGSGSVWARRWKGAFLRSNAGRARLGSLTDWDAPDLKAVRLGRMHLMFFASQKYLETCGGPWCRNRRIPDLCQRAWREDNTSRG